MPTKIYSFANCRMTVQSEKVIEDSGMYREFVGIDNNEKIKINVKIVESDLPPKSGKMIYSDRTHTQYEHLYTAYPVKKDEYTEYACRVVNGNEITLYINNCDTLWDSMIIEALYVPELLLKRGIATMHCSYINVNGEAILFAADKQMGKSTQAALWEKYRNAEIINGDRASVETADGKVWAYGIPFCGSSKIAKNRKLPVKAIVLLEKAPSDSICRLQTLNAFFEVLGKLTYENKDVEQAEIAIDTAKYLSENVPVFKLSCLPAESAVETLEEVLCQI